MNKQIFIVGNDALKVIVNPQNGMMNLYGLKYGGKVRMTLQESTELFDWLLKNIETIQQARDTWLEETQVRNIVR